MTAPFIGELRPFAFTYAPRNWMTASGQILPIAQYTALFSIFGTTYGGNGTTTFALPDLRGRMPVGNGNGAGLTPVVLGETFGTETVTLLSTQMPAHNHGASTKADPSSTTNMTDQPQAGYFVTRFVYAGGTASNAYFKPASGPIPTPTALHPTTLTITGGNQAHPNLQPLLAITWCVAIQGIFPTRN
jgi:microcystin-dependent protein